MNRFKIMIKTISIAYEYKIDSNLIRNTFGINKDLPFSLNLYKIKKILGKFN